MNTHANEKLALTSDIVARSIELHSEYACRELWAEQGKLEKWQKNIDAAWLRLLDAEKAFKNAAINCNHKGSLGEQNE